MGIGAANPSVRMCGCSRKRWSPCRERLGRQSRARKDPGIFLRQLPPYHPPPPRPASPPRAGPEAALQTPEAAFPRLVWTLASNPAINPCDGVWSREAHSRLMPPCPPQTGEADRSPSPWCGWQDVHLSPLGGTPAPVPQDFPHAVPPKDAAVERVAGHFPRESTSLPCSRLLQEAFPIPQNNWRYSCHRLAKRHNWPPLYAWTPVSRGSWSARACSRVPHPRAPPVWDAGTPWGLAWLGKGQSRGSLQCAVSDLNWVGHRGGPQPAQPQS